MNQFQYMAMGIPTGILLVVLLLLVFKFLYRPGDIHTINPQKAMSLRGMVPKADAREWIILGTMALVVPAVGGAQPGEGHQPRLVQGHQQSVRRPCRRC